MFSTEAASLTNRRQMELMAAELQGETMLWVLPGLYLASLALTAVAGRFSEPLQVALPALMLLLLAAAVWALHRWNRLAAAWVLAVGCLTVNLLMVAWANVVSAVCLLALPVGLAALFISIPGSALIAATCTGLLLLRPAAFLSLDSSLRIVALVGMWGTIALIWLAQHPILTALQWSWFSYEQNRQLLEQARDTQLRLGQALQDLAEANLQLTRLNRLAQGLWQEAEIARAAKEQFVARVSHELRTPLNMIIGFSEMIVESPQSYGEHLPPALLADLDVILRNSKHLSDLVDDVLDLSQIESGQMALTKEHVALHEIVEAAAIAVRPLFESKGLYLKMEIPEDLPLIFCDRTRIREVVLNLLSNAGRFTERGGVVVRAWREGDEVVVSVADTGPGIAPADVGKLFQPFQQLDGSIRRRYGGSGLGLSISKQLIELHGGRMWLKSAVGHGATFFFSLPILPPVPEDGGATRWLSADWPHRVRTHPSRAPIAVLRPRFVVWETGSALRRLLTRYLGDVEVVAVTDWEEAIQELSATPAQALLVNSASLGESLQRLSVSSALPYNTPIILCSVPDLSEVANSLGVSEYLIKPVSRDMLLAALDRLPGKGEGNGTSHITVLIVDDEPDAIQLFWRILDSAGRGFRVLTASNGRQALHIMREQQPDVVLLDLVMPDMDGFQFLAAKEADPVLRDIPTIVVSARDPSGQPVVSSAIAATRSGGLSVPQLLACVKALSEALAPMPQPGNPKPTTAPPG